MLKLNVAFGGRSHGGGPSPAIAGANPMAGPTNASIKCHLCLTEARDDRIRVAEHKLQWAAGRC